MPQLRQAMEQVFYDRDIAVEDVPRLDLYMDQVLALFDEGLHENKRHPADKLLTKTMVHNYAKEGLLARVNGKKYTRQQIMQLLCVYHLKQTLPLADVKALTGQDDTDYEACYKRLLAAKAHMRELVPPLLADALPAAADTAEDRLTLCLILSELASYMRRLCETLIDDRIPYTEGD